MTVIDKDLPVQEKNEADDNANRWVWWCNTRRIFAPAIASTILARLQPPSVQSWGEPDAFLDAAMPFFNMAVHALCEMGDHKGEAECFLGVYWYRVKIKALAGSQQCARGTVYNRARRFAQRAGSLSKSIKRVHEASLSEKCSKIIEQNSCTID